MPDLINGLFEFLASFLLLLNVLKLYRDKKVRGVCHISVTFMAIWGAWNLFFYPSIGAWWSFAFCIPVVIVNTIWVSQMFYYTRKESHESKL
jgi:hypothetical protein